MYPTEMLSSSIINPGWSCKTTLKLVTVIVLSYVAVINLKSWLTNENQQEESQLVVKRSEKVKNGMRDLKVLFAAKNKEKLHSLKAFCNSKKHEKGKKYDNMWWYSKQHNMLYCSNQKAGSSTMKEYFSELLPQKENKNLRLRFFAPQNNGGFKGLQAQAAEGLNGTLFVFSIVRHPFSHLVSAYYKFRKFVPSWTRWNKKAFEYSNASTEKPLTPLQVANFLINNKIQAGVMDHFKPYVLSCDFCSINFDAVFDVQTLVENLNLIAYGLKIEKWQNKKIHANSRSTPPMQNDAEKFFSQIPLDVAEKLFEFYQEDFELFGYTPDQYYELTKDYRESH